MHVRSRARASHLIKARRGPVNCKVVSRVRSRIRSSPDFAAREFKCYSSKADVVPAEIVLKYNRGRFFGSKARDGAKS